MSEQPPQRDPASLLVQPIHHTVHQWSSTSNQPTTASHLPSGGRTVMANEQGPILVTTQLAEELDHMLLSSTDRAAPWQACIQLTTLWKPAWEDPRRPTLCLNHSPMFNSPPPMALAITGVLTGGPPGETPYAGGSTSTTHTPYSGCPLPL